MGSSIRLDSLGQKLTSQEAGFHKDTVADLLRRTQTSFPGGQPVSFARRHLKELESVDYFVCEKTDGIRCLLYCTQLVSAPGQNAEEAYFLIDRKNDYYLTPQGRLHIPCPGQQVASFHTGTILDGELVLQKMPNGQQRKVYLIFDILCLDGVSVMDKTLEGRLGRIQENIFKPYQNFAREYPSEIPEFNFELDLKGFQKGYGIEMMFKDVIPKLRHGNDGLIFTCKTTPYVSGTDQHILKWKPPHENTIDFKFYIASFPVAVDEEGEYEDFHAKPKIQLWVNHGNRGGYKPYVDRNDREGRPTLLQLTDEEWERFKSLNQTLDGRIIECYRDAETGRWRPKMEHDTRLPRFRDDKTDANYIDTVTAVEESIVDAVTEEDLLADAMRIRTAWKQREEEAARNRRAGIHRQESHAAGPLPQTHGQTVAGQGRKYDEDDGPRYE